MAIDDGLLKGSPDSVYEQQVIVRYVSLLEEKL